MAPTQAARGSQGRGVDALLEFIKEGREEKKKASGGGDYFAAFVQQKARAAELENEKKALEVQEQKLRLEALIADRARETEE